MGTRYSLILSRYCKLSEDQIFRIDVQNSKEDLYAALSRSNKVIVATPTQTHTELLLDILSRVSGRNPPVDVLCEKPVVKTDAQLKQLLSWHTSNARLYMVNQYNYAGKKRGQDRVTRYHYFNSGPDGLIWDCIQLIQLADQKIELDRAKPVWMCHINGSEVNRADVDLFYIRMILDFIGPMQNLWGIDEITQATVKCLNLIDRFGENPMLVKAAV